MELVWCKELLICSNMTLDLYHKRTSAHTVLHFHMYHHDTDEEYTVAVLFQNTEHNEGRGAQWMLELGAFSHKRAQRLHSTVQQLNCLQEVMKLEKASAAD